MRPCGVRSMNPSRSRNGSWTSSIVSISSDRTAASAATPTGPEANFWTIAASSLRSAESRPSSSISIAPHRVARRRLVDVAVAVDLGVVADALEQPVDDPRRAPTASGDRPDGGRLDPDAEDLGRAADDRGQLLVGVEVEPVGRPEPVTQRGADAARAGRRADDGERLEAEPQRSRRRALADHHVERVVLHRRVEDLLDRAVEAVDLVDEQDVALVERGEDRGEVAGALDGRTGRVADVDPELARDDRREGRLAEAGRAVQEDVVGRLSPALGRLEQHRQVGLDLGLADVFGERPRPQAALDDEVRLVLEIARKDARDVVDHRADGSTADVHIARMFYVHEACAAKSHHAD